MPVHHRSLVLLGLIAALALALLLNEQAASEKPSVLLVVMDTVRADRTSTYGYPRPTTIQLDAVARAGVVFEDVTAPGSWTWPSHASLFTGLPPWEHGAHLVSREQAAALSRDAVVEGSEVLVGRMRGDLPTLAERFARAGYRTRALFANEWLAPDLGLTRGFEEATLLENDAATTRAALEEVAREDDRPLFLFVNLMSAHEPWMEGPGEWASDPGRPLTKENAPDWLDGHVDTEEGLGVMLSRAPDAATPDAVTRYLGGELVIPPEGLALLGRLYDAGVRGADFSMGQIVAAWAARFPKGVVAVTSDHGEALGEHRHLTHTGSVYPEVLAVPLVIAAPGRLPAGRRVEAPVGLQRLYPTLLELAGIDRQDASLLPLLDGEPPAAPVTASAWPKERWAEAAGGRFAMRRNLHREGDRALIWSADGRAELYDLGRDPGMLQDLGPREPARLRALLAEATAHLAAQPAAPSALVELDPQTRESLVSLGYLDPEL